MRVETPFEIKQRSSNRKVITEEPEDLQKDMAELNQVMMHEVHSAGSDSIRNESHLGQERQFKRPNSS